MSRAVTRNKRTIAVVTGTRAEYGLLTSTMGAIARHRSLELRLVVTGIHLLKQFGGTVREIERDGWTIDACVPMQRGTDSPSDQADGLARGVTGIAAFLEESRCDIVLVLGDRIEAMAGALAAVTTGRILAHVHGGDVAVGDFDESLRHAITKLAHLHFPATKSAARRIVRMGEEAARVHCVGAPGIDDLAALVRAKREHVKPGGRAIVLYHACGRAPEQERQTMRIILAETIKAGLAPTILFPNSDRGHTGVIRAIEEFVDTPSGKSATVCHSLERAYYLSQLIDADLLIGNSSSGIIEAATAGTAVVNVGDRQQGRERAGRSVVNAKENASAIRRAIAQALRSRPRMGVHTVYGDGKTGPRIASELARLRLDENVRRKQCVY